ncbi:MAG TPA: alpha/beta hydrolase-fold protein, partial [Acidobacteriota bacterium]|nr:alpha/beta hydrolase-fold protein [Acidobacteriota bacterium]
MEILVSPASPKKPWSSLILYTAATLILLLSTAEGVSNLRQFHRSGQTFLTWREDSAVSGELFKIYRATSPFQSASDLTSNRAIAVVPEDSSLYYTDICRGVQPQEQYQPHTRYVIRDLAPPLAPGIGLFVSTTKQTGTYYYAITQVVNGKENKKINPDVVRGPVNEILEQPIPVLVWKSADGLNRVYTHWMDFESWNNTFDAPRELNNYCGFSPQQVSIQRAMQYAYSYLVALPRGYNPTGAKKYPLAIYLHGFNQRYISRGEPERFGWPVIEIAPDDPNSSWWYGFADKTDYRFAKPQLGEIVNFTELRVLEELRQTTAIPDVHADTRKIYVHGQSMGGSGAIALGMRYPSIFSQIYAGQPQTNFQLSIPRFKIDLEGKWGTRQLNLKISNRGEAAAELQRYNGTRVWDWQNFTRELLRRKTDDMSFIMVDHGTEDTNAPWQIHGLPFYTALYSTNRAYYAVVNSASHEWQNFVARGYNGFSYTERVFPNVSETIISFTSPASLPSDPFYSRLFQWAGSVRRFAAPIEDAENRFAVSVRTNSNQTL